MALVLSRKVGETIRIGEEIEIILTRIHGNRVRLAVQAPKTFPITRGEHHGEVGGDGGGIPGGSGS